MLIFVTSPGIPEALAPTVAVPDDMLSSASCLTFADMGMIPAPALSAAVTASSFLLADGSIACPVTHSIADMHMASPIAVSPFMIAFFSLLIPFSAFETCLCTL